ACGWVTSMPLMRYQWSTGVASGRSVASTWLPASRYEVVREPGCEVSPGVACPSAMYTVTVRLLRGAKGKSSGSETICAPTGITTLVRPWKVTGTALWGSMADTPACPPAGSATVTAVIGRGAVPNAFDSRSRIREPPTETRTVCRRVVLTRKGSGLVNGGGGRFSGSASCGMATQVCTQRGVGSYRPWMVAPLSIVDTFPFGIGAHQPSRADERAESRGRSRWASLPRRHESFTAALRGRGRSRG